MKCKKFEKMLPEYLYGDISEKDKQVFMGHVSDCAGCRNQLSEMEESLVLLQSIPKPDFSEPEMSALRHRVKEEVARWEDKVTVPTRRRTLHWPLLIPRFAPVAVLVAVVAIIGLILLRQPAVIDQPVKTTVGPVNDLVAMTKEMEDEYQSITEICQEIEDLKALFYNGGKAGPEAGIKRNPLTAPA